MTYHLATNHKRDQQTNQRPINHDTVYRNICLSQGEWNTQNFHYEESISWIIMNGRLVQTLSAMNLALFSSSLAASPSTSLLACSANIRSWSLTPNISAHKHPQAPTQTEMLPTASRTLLLIRDSGIMRRKSANYAQRLLGLCVPFLQIKHELYSLNISLSQPTQ